MRGSTVRLSESMWTVVAHAAATEGITTAQFVREAAIMRAIWLMTTRREIDPTFETLDEMVKQLRDD